MQISCSHFLMKMIWNNPTLSRLYFLCLSSFSSFSFQTLTLSLQPFLYIFLLHSLPFCEKRENKWICLAISPFSRSFSLALSAFPSLYGRYLSLSPPTFHRLCSALSFSLVLRPFSSLTIAMSLILLRFLFVNLLASLSLSIFHSTPIIYFLPSIYFPCYSPPPPPALSPCRDTPHPGMSRLSQYTRQPANVIEISGKDMFDSRFLYLTFQASTTFEGRQA